MVDDDDSGFASCGEEEEEKGGEFEEKKDKDQFTAFYNQLSKVKEKEDRSKHLVW